MNKNLKEIIIIILISIFLAGLRFQFLPDEFQLLAKKKDAEIKQNIGDNYFYYSELTSPEVVTLDKAKEIYDDNFAVFIDAREYSDFINGHILNAISLPYSENQNYDSALVDSLYNLDKTLVVYCSGHGCSLGEDLTYFLFEEFEIPKIVYFEEGYPAWKDNKFPIQENITKKINIDTENKQIFLFNNVDYLILVSFLVIAIFYLSNSYRKHIPLISRFILGFVFIYFSIDKIQDPVLFAKTAGNYDIIPFGLENLGALVLPFVELIIGLCLIFGIFLKSSNAIAFSLLVMFIFMLLQAYVRGKSIDCGCLLSDLNDTSAYEKRIHMLIRIIQDIYFLVLVIIVKYKDKFKGN
tara:strand:+ start:760 stop:1818 length:1059 start_codon:yes stop_codon:yes gene_type:complete